MALHQLECRWTGREDFTDVDFVWSLEEAKSRAVLHQADHNVHATILWVEGENGVYWGRSKRCTFRMVPI